MLTPKKGFILMMLESVARQFKRVERRICCPRVRKKLALRHVRGDGIEVGALHQPLRVGRQARVRYVDRLSKDDLLAQYPEFKSKHLVEPDIVDNGEKLAKFTDGSLDFVIANHFIEHCEDPLGTLKTFLAKLKDGGILYLAVPDKRFCFDRGRPLTAWEHVYRDFADGGKWSRREHFTDYTRFVHFQHETPSACEVERVADKLMRRDYSIHFHVWTLESFRDLLQKFKATICGEFDELESRLNYHEAIFILRKCATGNTGDTFVRAHR